LINTFAENYHQKDLFHGDIKPENIFIWDYVMTYNILCTTDIGSLLYLGKVNETEGATFIVTCYTEKYASA
jgi:hypothetical protein